MWWGCGMDKPIEPSDIDVRGPMMKVIGEDLENAARDFLANVEAEVWFRNIGDDDNADYIRHLAKQATELVVRVGVAQAALDQTA